MNDHMCFVIPVFNHIDGICNTVPSLAKHGLTCIVVDDGSNTLCARAIDTLEQQHNWVKVVRRETNGGKGAAVKTGLSMAATMGFSHAFQLDADQQHDLSVIDECMRQSSSAPLATILGQPLFDESIPKIRQLARYLTHVWVWINTLSFAIEDSMCGLRIYPIEPTLEVCNSECIGNHMEFDIEILVRLYWRGMSFLHVPVQTYYPEDGVSHFRMVEDNWLITKTHTKLFFGMIRRSRKLLKRAFSV